MLTDIRQGFGESKRKPGTWIRVLEHTDEPDYRPYWSAIIFCPACGKPLTLKRHTISADGWVSPSLGHPPEFMPCAWHTSPHLVGWEADKWELPQIPDPERCERCGKVSHTIGGWGIVGGVLLCQECCSQKVMHAN